MPVETFSQQVRRPVRTTVTSTPPRLRPKGPMAPEVYRQCLAAAGRPKQSAVERLEADKAKYVKSQVALSKQQPVRSSEVNKPLSSPRSALQPTRKAPIPTKSKESIQLDVEHLSNLISDVNYGLQPSTEETKPPESLSPQKKERPPPPPRPDWSCPAKVRLKSPAPPREESAPSPPAGTVRRVDVMPQTSSMRPPVRPAQFMRKPLQPIPLHSQFPLHGTRLFHPRTPPSPSPLKPVIATPPNPENNAPLIPPLKAPTDSAPLKPAPVPLKSSTDPAPPDGPVLPPPSPAITRLSSSSARKRPSLTRSKSDLSDRFSRADTELERFFNLCGLDPSDLQDLTASNSDIVSLARFRSVSAPGSECAGSGRDNEEEDDEDDEEGTKNPAARVPYGVSVIERNARVIKWLYGVRQSKDNVIKSTNL